MQLAEALSRDLSAQILPILAAKKLMSLEYEKFEAATATCHGRPLAGSAGVHARRMTCTYTYTSRRDSDLEAL